MTAVRVRCPSDRCGIVFEPHERWLGRNMHCPACGVRMTARPVAVDAELAQRPGRVAGGDGAAAPRLPFAVLLDNVRSLWNVGSIFRSADACGASRVVLTGITGCPPRPEITKTALGAEEWVAWEYQPDAYRALRELAERGYAAVALESTPRAVPLHEAAWPAGVCLVVGNEVAGVSPAVLDACPLHVAIPMLGAKSSLNVAVAFGIAGFHIATALARRASAPLHAAAGSAGP